MQALLVRAGATVMFSEVTEVRDAIDQLTSRAINAEGRDARFARCLVRRVLQKAASTAAPNHPGNKRARLSNMSRSDGQPSSQQPAISSCWRRVRRSRQKGLIYSATPASDSSCGTLQRRRA